MNTFCQFTTKVNILMLIIFNGRKQSFLLGKVGTVSIWISSTRHFWNCSSFLDLKLWKEETREETGQYFECASIIKDRKPSASLNSVTTGACECPKHKPPLFKEDQSRHCGNHTSGQAEHALLLMQNV